jgi:hypothetical protein
MLRALYYPHTDIQSPVILKNALLLWDSIETIVPHANWQRPGAAENARIRRRGASTAGRLLREAIELIVRPRVPSLVERERTRGGSAQRMNRNGVAPQLVVPTF